MTHIAAHALVRGYERFGVMLGEDDARAAVLDIIEGRALLQQRTLAGREVYIAQIAGKPARIVYVPNTAMIISVLPIHREHFRQPRRSPRDFRGRDGE